MTLAEGVRIVSFGILAATTIGAALGVVLLRNIVYSAFLLAGVFISISGIYLLLNADFLAAAQVLIYVGAINVLILFAIMLVNKTEDFSPVRNRWVRQGTTALVCGGLFALLGTMVLATEWDLAPASEVPIANSVLAIGKHFFSDYLLPFELASVLLLMAMVGAIVLARRDLIPEGEASDLSQPEAYTLQERPRELLAVGSEGDGE